MTSNPFYVATTITKKVTRKSAKKGSHASQPITHEVHARVKHHKSVSRWIWGLCIVAIVVACL